MSGYFSLHQASRISRPLDVALTICQCGPRFSVSILFFFKEPTFLERAPGGSHPSGGPHLAGRASFKKKGKGTKQKKRGEKEGKKKEIVHFPIRNALSRI